MRTSQKDDASLLIAYSQTKYLKVNISSQLGVLLGASTGIIRSVYGDGDLVCDIIPCDFVVNCIIAAGASTASTSSKSLEVYNCTSSKHLGLTWNGFLDLGK